MNLGPYSTVIHATDEKGTTLYLCENDLWSANPRDARHWAKPLEAQEVRTRISWKATNIYNFTDVTTLLVSTDEFRSA